MGEDASLGLINEHPYDDGLYTDAANNLTDECAACIDALWRAGASVQNLSDELTSALHNSDVPGALSLVVKIERQS